MKTWKNNSQKYDIDTLEKTTAKTAKKKNSSSQMWLICGL